MLRNVRAGAGALRPASGRPAAARAAQPAAGGPGRAASSLRPVQQQVVLLLPPRAALFGPHLSAGLPGLPGLGPWAAGSHGGQGSRALATAAGFSEVRRPTPPLPVGVCALRAVTAVLCWRPWRRRRSTAGWRRRRWSTSATWSKTTATIWTFSTLITRSGPNAPPPPGSLPLQDEQPPSPTGWLASPVPAAVCVQAGVLNINLGHHGAYVLNMQVGVGGTEEMMQPSLIYSYLHVISLGRASMGRTCRCRTSRSGSPRPSGAATLPTAPACTHAGPPPGRVQL